METTRFPVLIGDTIVISDGKGLLLYGQGAKKVARAPNLSAAVREKLAHAGFFRETSSEHTPTSSSPSNLMLLLSKRCPLRCVYCYANTGMSNGAMSIELAERAIAHYLSFNPKNPRVTLFGAGEPTSASAVIKHVVAKYGSRIRWVLTTSGVMPRGFLEWLIDRDVALTFSIDGPPSIQDVLRPMKDGSRSSPYVERAMRVWKKSLKPLSVRTTVTGNSAPRIGEILEYFQEFDVDRVHLEPEYGVGRGSAHRRSAPLTVMQWVDVVLFALEWARKASKKVRIGELAYIFGNVSNRSYCGPMGGSTMVVNHRGELTACSEVDDALNDRWPVFSLGTDAGNFLIEREKLERLAARRPANMERCKGCFVRNVCRGGCAHKGLVATGDLFTPDSTHCAFMRAIVPCIIQRMAEGTYSQGDGHG